jgi:hypothetical protein
VEKLMQRNSLFRTSCNTKDGVCKVIIYSGSTDNLVSTRDGGEIGAGDN